MSLKDEFQKYVGLVIRDPDRMTCDMDPEAQKISDLAGKHGLMAAFSKDDGTSEPFMLDVEAVHVEITQDGVPADATPGSWKVKAFHFDC